MTSGLPGKGDRRGHARIEDRARDDVLAALAGPRLAESLRAVAADDNEVAHLAAQLRDDERALEELSEDFYVNRLIPRAEFLGARRGARRPHHRLQAGIGAWSRQGVLADLSADEDALRASWDAHDVDWRRTGVRPRPRFDRVAGIAPPSAPKNSQAALGSYQREPQRCAQCERLLPGTHRGGDSEGPCSGQRQAGQPLAPGPVDGRPHRALTQDLPSRQHADVVGQGMVCGKVSARDGQSRKPLEGQFLLIRG